MKEYRVTKYDPKYRNSTGSYTIDDWTCFSDVGKEFGGAILTLVDYEAAETAYLDSAIDILHESGCGQLQVTDLENHWNVELDFRAGEMLEGLGLRNAMKLVLRNVVWARFSSSSGCFVHFGHDFYMYVGITKVCERALRVAGERGLFVEPCTSPYRNLTE